MKPGSNENKNLDRWEGEIRRKEKEKTQVFRIGWLIRRRDKWPDYKLGPHRRVIRLDRGAIAVAKALS